MTGLALGPAFATRVRAHPAVPLRGPGPVPRPPFPRASGKRRPGPSVCPDGHGRRRPGLRRGTPLPDAPDRARPDRIPARRRRRRRPRPAAPARPERLKGGARRLPGPGAEHTEPDPARPARIRPAPAAGHEDGRTGRATAAEGPGPGQTQTGNGPARASGRRRAGAGQGGLPGNPGTGRYGPLRLGTGRDPAPERSIPRRPRAAPQGAQAVRPRSGPPDPGQEHPARVRATRPGRNRPGRLSGGNGPRGRW